MYCVCSDWSVMNWKEYLLNVVCLRNCVSNYTCPLCCHSTVDMTAQWRHLDDEVAATQMPDEYRDVMVWILCRDCHKVLCRIRIHFRFLIFNGTVSNGHFLG